MPEPAVQRSQRFTKAARAEHDRLARKRSRILEQREGLQARIDLLDEELEAVGREIDALAALALPSGGHSRISLVETERDGEPTSLKGAAIRKLAVPLLLGARGTAPIHYREWLELLTKEGYAVAGKRPDAVFLNQVVRSPLVRATTRAGYYEVDLNAVDRLREKLGKQQWELADLMRSGPSGAGEIRERQRELSIAIARTERELDEATAAVEAWEGGEGSGAAEVQAA